VANICQCYGQFTDILVSVEKRFAFVTFANKEAAQYALFKLSAGARMADQEEREFQKTNTKLYIGNLPGHFPTNPANPKQTQKEAAVEYVANICQCYGQFTDILVSVEKRFAFVTFANKEAAQYALFKLADSTVGGNVLHVSWAKPTKEQLAARDARKAREQADATKPKTDAEKEKEKTDKAAAKDKSAEVKLVVEEKPEPVRFSTQQKVAVKQPPKTVAQQPAPVAQPVKKVQNKPPAAKASPPQQRFRVTVQNETTPGLPTVVLSISYDEWTKYICPLISNNPTPHVTQ